MNSDPQKEIQNLRIQLVAHQELLEVQEQAVLEQSSKLEKINQELNSEITERKRAEIELQKAHQELLDTSRIIGMSEIASNVLHNVGNVLNSVNVSANLAAENIRKTKVDKFVKAAAILREHEQDMVSFIANGPKWKQLVTYFIEFSGHLASIHESTLKELTALHEYVEHIKEIIAMQQSYAKLTGEKELVKITDLVEDSLRMNVGALTRHHIEVLRDYDDISPIYLYRHKILQILVNLVRNAKYACDDSGDPKKQITLRVSNKNGRIRIYVIDNGIGILPKNLPHIFERGFTTRKDGHGFGLHGSSMTAKEMGGCLSAESNSPEKGATFILELPMQTSPTNEQGN